MTRSCLRWQRFLITKLGRFPFCTWVFRFLIKVVRLTFWDPVLARNKSRLFGWKSHNLSYGGLLILLKCVLSYLLVYAFSFVKAPLGIITSIESIFNKFLWGGCEEHSKIVWVD